MLTFDAIKHKYFWNDEEIPGVTHILKTIGITRDYTGVDEFYRIRGQHVHKAIEFYSNGSLDESTIDQVHVRPYLEAFKKFVLDTGYTVHSTEKMLCRSKAKGKFAGTIDQYGGFAVGGVGIVDFKVTEDSDKAADLQLCGYAVLFYENHGYWPVFRMALELHNDQSYRPIYYRTNPNIWNAVMRLYEWKITRRKKEVPHEKAA